MDEWLAIIERAGRLLTPDGYKRWTFIVGSSGTLEERCELGRQALVMATYKLPRIVGIHGGPSEFKRA